MQPLYDFTTAIHYEEGITLQEKSSYKKLLGTGKRILSKPNDSALYFETDELSSIRRKLKKYDLEICHGTKKQPWGQKVLRFYDPDGHLIEAAEPMSSVIKGLKKEGLSMEEIAKKTGLSATEIKLGLKLKKKKKG